MIRKASMLTLLALSALFATAGCEQKSPAPTTPSTTTAPAPVTGTSAAPDGTPTPTPAAPGTAPGSAASKLVIGVVAKSQTNPVFQAAKSGAEDAARDLSKKYNVEITALWQTPVNEDAQKQAQFVEQLVSQGVDGIAISCTDGQVLQRPIDAAVEQGVLVCTFDSDSPNSKRFAYYGINDVDAGKAVMRELAKAMGETGGPVAVLAGNQTAPNLQARVRGVREELDTLKDRGFTLKEVYYHKETADAAAAMVQQVQTANPDIAGWAMVGGWPLFTQNALNGVADKGVKVASVDHLREQLNYVKKGEVQALIGQDCYGWGYESVRMIVEKIIEKKDPPQVINNFDLKIVTKDNVAEVEGLWDKWLGNK